MKGQRLLEAQTDVLMIVIVLTILALVIELASMMEGHDLSGHVTEITHFMEMVNSMLKKCTNIFIKKFGLRSEHIIVLRDETKVSSFFVIIILTKLKPRGIIF